MNHYAKTRTHVRDQHTLECACSARFEGDDITVLDEQFSEHQDASTHT